MKPQKVTLSGCAGDGVDSNIVHYKAPPETGIYGLNTICGCADLHSTDLDPTDTSPVSCPDCIAMVKYCHSIPLIDIEAV